jgi:hypothetical protein
MHEASCLHQRFQILKKDSASFRYSVMYVYMKKRICTLSTAKNLKMYKNNNCIIHYLAIKWHALKWHKITHYTRLHDFKSHKQMHSINRKPNKITRINELQNTAQETPKGTYENNSTGGPTHQELHYERTQHRRL